MKLIVYEPGEALEPAWMDAAYRLRHDVFVEEMGWSNLRRDDRREIDQFDGDAVHFLLVDGAEVAGYQRLLATTGPYLMSEIYPQLCEVEMPRDRTVCEWSRLAIEKDRRGDDGMGAPALVMVRAMVEWCLRNKVETVLVATSPIMMLKFVQCHFRIEPMGLLQQIDGRDVIALAAHLDRRTLIRLDQLIEQAQPLLKTA